MFQYSHHSSVQDSATTLQPAFLSLVLGIVLSEEISASMINVSLLILGTPSLAAHSLLFPFCKDWIRQVIVFSFAVASVKPKYASWWTLAGVAMALGTLLTNLGARSWYFLQLRPLQSRRMIPGHLAALLLGFGLPFCGHRSLKRGGHQGVSMVLRSSLIVAVVFVLSNHDTMQRFLVIGSEACNQNWVNVGVGIWWFVASVCCLASARNVPTKSKQTAVFGEQLLEVEHKSPVGYVVPCIPNYVVDPCCHSKSRRNLNMDFVLSILAVAVVFVGILGATWLGWENGGDVSTGDLWKKIQEH